MAKHPDEDALFAFIWSADEEMPFGLRDEVKVRDMVKLSCATPQEFSISQPRFGIVRGDRGIEAAIGLIANQWWWTHDYCLHQFFFQVHPGFRDRGHGARLMRFAKWFADSMGMPVRFEILGETKGSKTSLFERHSDPSGASFFYGMRKTA